MLEWDDPICFGVLIKAPQLRRFGSENLGGEWIFECLDVWLCGCFFMFGFFAKSDGLDDHGIWLGLIGFSHGFELSLVSLEFVDFDVVNVHLALYTPHHCIWEV